MNIILRTQKINEVLSDSSSVANGTLGVNFFMFPKLQHIHLLVIMNQDNDDHLIKWFCDISVL